MTRCWCLLLAAAFAFVATDAAAQSTNRFGIEASGLYATLSGDDFDGTDAGMGFDIQARYMSSPRFSLGAGIHRTSHGIDGASNDEAVMGFFAEPRLHFAMADQNVKPYLTARGSYLMASLDEAGDEYRANGYLFGFGAGAGWMISPTVQLNGAVTYNLVSLGDVEVNGTSIDGTDSSGSSLAIRFGIGFSFR